MIMLKITMVKSSEPRIIKETSHKGINLMREAKIVQASLKISCTSCLRSKVLLYSPIIEVKFNIEN